MKYRRFLEVLLISAFIFLCQSTAYSETDNSLAPAGAKRGKAVYERYCLGCHGAKGNGKGPFAAGLYPAPRDFRGGTFKWTSGPAGSLPSDEDLMMTITGGVYGTAMPAWRGISEFDKRYVIEYIKSFSPRFSKDRPGHPTFIYPPPHADPAVMAEKGKKVYEKTGCATCHGEKGRGDGASAPELKDDWENPITPANFTKGNFKTGKEDWKIFRSISNGLGGTPMPSFVDQLKPEEIWALVYYVRSLKE